ncbi:hypothetical protein [Cupriavidus sp. CuC1]|uniref:hypothetical protein n=1 Tax=Cupriavidus sp. CuC1 TaxID=3373131 RepID=UPI0037CEA5A6
MNAQHWIAGAWTGEPSADSVNPADGTLIGQFADGGTWQAEAAIAAARHVFERTTWGQDARLRQDVLLVQHLVNRFNNYRAANMAPVG